MTAHIKNELLKIAADLARCVCLGSLSSIEEEMPKTTPKKVLSDIERAEDRLRRLAMQITNLANEHLHQKLNDQS